MPIPPLGNLEEEGGMALSEETRKKMRREFQDKAGTAFDEMFDDDQQEQLITLTQREDRVLQKGAALQAWLLEQHLNADPLTDAAAQGLRCPKCHGVGARDTCAADPIPRALQTRAGPQSLKRWKYWCPSCRTVFFPLGR
jgi:hypothetical protein